MAVKRGVDYMKAMAKYLITNGQHDKIVKCFNITDGGDGLCLGEFTVAKQHLNAFGGLHGGFTATLVDNVTTYALMSCDCHPGVTVDLHVSYFKSAKEGEVIIVDANTLKVGKRLAFMECILKKKSDNSLIARGEQTKFVDLPVMK